MSSTMRKRGWSIHSEGEQSHGTKHSAMTEQSEETMTDAEKLKLLRNFPSGDSVNDGMDGSKNDVIEMFGSDDEKSEQRSLQGENSAARKRSKVDDTSDYTTNQESNGPVIELSISASNGKNEDETKRFNAAKGRLSKWAARLFDPNRPRGLVEPPQVIPLNDEFLKAFGKREKEHDDKTGRIIEIDQSNLDEITDDENDETLANDAAKSIEMASKIEKQCKVKVVNLAYATKENTICEAFQKYGALVEIDLISDPDNVGMSLGRAYVTFEKPKEAEKCIEKLNETCLDGRVIRVSLYHNKNKPKRTVDTPAKSSIAKRYWLNDISTKCYRCGEVGHTETNCKNEAKPKPCPMCAQYGHDIRSCPFSKICFNCGVPGHINRECPQRRGLPKRMVCGLCYQSGHHRWTCSETNMNNINTRFARCLVCGEEGHLMCAPMRWFFGLKGKTCFNCGRTGHHGISCERPTFQACEKNAELALEEIEKAEALSLADDMSMQSTRVGRSRDPREQGRQGQPINDRYDNNGRNRSKSTPPVHNFRSQNQVSTYGRIQQHHGGRGIDRALSSQRDHTYNYGGNNNRGYGSTNRSSAKRHR